MNNTYDYIDCTSGIQHLHDLNIKNEDCQAALDDFKRCFYDGCVSSRCGRTVISRHRYLENVNRAIDAYQDEVLYVFLGRIIEAALKAVWDNCAIEQGDSYYPKEADAEENTKVWVVKDDDGIDGIYSTEEKAQASIDRMTPSAQGWYGVIEYTLDEETK